MILPALAWAVISSSLLFIGTPRFPEYQIASLQLLSVSILPLIFTWRLTCTVNVGVEVDNVNFIGAQVHGILVDMYYPREYSDGRKGDRKRNRQLYHVAQVKDKRSHYCDLLRYHVRGGADSASPPDGANKGIARATIGTSCKGDNPTAPVLPPRESVMLYNNIVSVDNLGPWLSFTMAIHTIWNGGTIGMLSTGVAHVKTNVLGLNNSSLATIKSTMSLPLTVMVLCDNKIDAFVYPARIVERTCTPVDVHPGWLNMTRQGEKLQKMVESRYKLDGSVLVIRGGVDMLGGQSRDDSDAVEMWHDF